MRSLMEDTSLVENIIDSVFAMSASPAIEDEGKDYFIVEVVKNGKTNIGLISHVVLHSIINKIDPTTSFSKVSLQKNEGSLIYVFWSNLKKRYFYVYNSRLIFNSVEHAKAYCSVAGMEPYLEAKIKEEI